MIPHAMASAISTHPKLELLTASRILRLSFGRRRDSNSKRDLLNSVAFPNGRRSARLLLSGASSYDGAVDANAQQDVEAFKSGVVGPGDGYVGLFVRMLGIDNDPLDREQAIVALWKYSQGGKQCINAIMKFSGSINLTVNLLKSDTTSTCEAAAGLLREISSINVYRNAVAESGAIEEIIGLLNRSPLTAEVKEQSICTLWNLSVDDNLRAKIANMDLLPALVKFIDDEEVKVKEAAGGVLANLALTHSNHSMMVEAGVIQKLAEHLKSKETSKIVRKEAKNILLELAKDEYYKILLIEQGLVIVPLIGAAAYRSFRSVSYSWPSLPDGTKFERSSSSPSRFGASELLLGLNIRDRTLNMEEAKMNAIVGRTQQNFLARIGAIEMEERGRSQLDSSLNQQYTILPWIDGIARLVLILGLEDESAIARAAQSIADASINEHMRKSFKEAGAVKHLILLLGHDNETVKVAGAHALDRLSVSYEVCQIIEAEGVIYPLVNILKDMNTSEDLLEKTVNILARIFDPGKEMKTKFRVGKINGTKKTLDVSSLDGIKGLAFPDDTSVFKPMAREEVLDSVFISRLVDILKTPFPNLQRMTASILDCLATTEQYAVMITESGIESGLDALFQQRCLNDMKDDGDDEPEVNAIEAEEAGLAISAASRLLTKLLNFDYFQSTINSTNLMHILRKVLKLDIPLHSKDWVAACLVKLESLAGSNVDLESPINMEVTLYETIPRLIEQIRTAFSPEEQEAAVIQLNDIMSIGVVDFTRAVAAQGGIFPLVKLIKNGNGSALDASLAILYNLSMDSENHSAIIAAGAVPILKRIVLSEGPQWMRALHLLRTLPT